MKQVLFLSPENLSADAVETSEDCVKTLKVNGFNCANSESEANIIEMIYAMNNYAIAEGFSKIEYEFSSLLECA